MFDDVCQDQSVKGVWREAPLLIRPNEPRLVQAGRRNRNCFWVDINTVDSAALTDEFRLRRRTAATDRPDHSAIRWYHSQNVMSDNVEILIWLRFSCGRTRRGRFKRICLHDDGAPSR